MPLIRLQNNTPQVYTDKSRDFQLLCRAYDGIINGIKFDADSIVDIINTKKCNARLLSLLQTKVGFFTDSNITDEDMRYALLAFPNLVKSKGSLRAIKQTLNVFLKLNHIKTGVYVSIINKAALTTEDSYSIRIGIESGLKDLTVINEIFKYILPTGYKIQYFFYITPQAFSAYLSQDDTNVAYVTDVINAQVKSTNELIGNSLFNNLILNSFLSPQDINFSSYSNNYTSITSTGTGQSTNIFYDITKVYDDVVDKTEIFNLSGYTYQLSHTPIVPGTLNIYQEGAYCCDDGKGNLIGTLLPGGITTGGSINYTTGEIIFPNETTLTNIDATFEYKSGGWIDQEYRKIDFGNNIQMVEEEFYLWCQNNTDSTLSRLMGTVSMTEIVGNIADTTISEGDITINSGTQVIGYISDDKNKFYQDFAKTIEIIPLAESPTFIYLDIGTGIPYTYNSVNSPKFTFVHDPAHTTINGE